MARGGGRVQIFWDLQYDACEGSCGTGATHIQSVMFKNHRECPSYITHFVAEKASRNVDLLAPDDNDFLAREDLL
jgi:hypothetical protein